MLESADKQVEASPIHLVVERNNDSSELPKRFRMSRDAVIVDEVNAQIPDLKGFVELKASASGQYSQRELQSMKEAIGDLPIILVDLRQENHGFVNGMAVNWFGLHNGANKGLSNDEVIIKEQQLLNGLKNQPSITFDELKGKSVDIGGPVQDPKQILSEEELAEAEGLKYKRFFVTDHHRPLDQEVDHFIEWVKALPDDVWLHFHCRGGVGRASTFFCMYDMMRNADEVGFEDHTRRQMQIGGRDFQRMDPKDVYKYQAAVDRLTYVRQFYEYCVSNIGDGYTVSWTEWIANEKGENYPCNT
ncbi:protein tyrosine phosphatase [Paenibacillus sp. LMG 31456]|uniref:Protein tyrosine phosphatase n=1 Tax=Paenibacillus foliorum TaxID=2654974 RepID=A0A972H3Z7_9BACL|nr:protein tyrosine phosphatase [Paenibacillus foliorum]NOU95851.1 protein tyrosine phosphatase [Paenibacillus foliorum]